ncbi:bifunctional methyltransferase/pyrophosphohydrolase YabN [Alkalibacter mobilis]|uniref:nucleoside triphosphate pyrophosphohydrolase n=1 Tax=Alkalibacter mobilis TaxID=2787712 RepID=UPI00189D4D07|nr:nucleoside triphosphate pyrophosphohydrolase [Alkalibacter mobilis]MBF7096932.1 nucleoside triphosphate pyrophosphohydrolase [Alkalibacter mobilis]
MDKTIYIVGLGAGGLGQMTIETYNVIKNSSKVYFRTGKHPAVEELKSEGIEFETFDELYQESESFDQVYQGIAEILVNEAEKYHELVYGVPGHPLFAEKSVEILLEILDNKHCEVKVRLMSAVSFVDNMAAALRIDPVKGLAIVDALSANRKNINTHMGILVTQVYDKFVASELKLMLTDGIYDGEKEVYLVHGAGTNCERIERINLYELDRSEHISYLTTLYIPPEKLEDPKKLDVLMNTMKTLRSEDGCPWDARQTYESLRKYVIEEAYEVVDAIERQDWEGLSEELGDLLLQIVFLSTLAEEDYYFDIGDVIEGINNKLVHRHPHVFGDEDKENFNAHLWEKLKRQEKGHIRISDQMDVIPKNFPAYMRAEKVQKKAALAGFDWKDPLGAMEKVKEEIVEIHEAMKTGDKTQIISESGDLVFAVVNVLRLLKVDFREALDLSTEKFIKRFKDMEIQAEKNKVKIEELSLEELESLWKIAKQRESDK